DSTVRAAHAAHNGACYTTWSSCTATERCRPLRCSLRRHQPLKCWLWATAHPPCLATLVMTGISPCPLPAWPRSTIRFPVVPATRVQAPADSTASKISRRAQSGKAPRRAVSLYDLAPYDQRDDRLPRLRAQRQPCVDDGGEIGVDGGIRTFYSAQRSARSRYRFFQGFALCFRLPLGVSPAFG